MRFFTCFLFFFFFYFSHSYWSSITFLLLLLPVVWAWLSDPRYQSSPLTVAKWRRHISIEDWVSVSSRLLLSRTLYLNTSKARRWADWKVPNHTNPSTDEMTDWQRAKFLHTVTTENNTQVQDIVSFAEYNSVWWLCCQKWVNVLIQMYN